MLVFTNAMLMSIVVSLVMALIIGVPVVYFFVLLARVPLLLLNLTSFDTGDYFVKSIYGALIGVGISITITVLEAFKIATGPKRKIDMDEFLNEFFLLALTIRAPGAFLIASSLDAPVAPLACIIFGSTCGFVAALSAIIYTKLKEDEPIGEAGVLISIFEALFVLVLLRSMPSGLLHSKSLYQTLGLILPACATCITTYLLARSGSAIIRRISNM